ncbi:MAG TPA: oxidoreductase, partial [Lentisphaeria bacterium]|nr:oxidoreductase [Lentisphaeria bacterium]
MLAPSNPEKHEELAHAVLASGKPVFIDKPFAPDGEAAERLFARADRFRTPLFS